MSAAPKYCYYFTLWLKRPSCIKVHSVITNNCKKIIRKYQLFYSTSERRPQRPQLLQKYNVRIKSSARNDHCPPWHKLKDGDATDAQLQQLWRDAVWPTRFWFWCDVWGWDQWCVFCTPVLAVCSTCSSQPDLNLANLEATETVKWTPAFVFPETPR